MDELIAFLRARLLDREKKAELTHHLLCDFVIEAVDGHVDEDLCDCGEPARIRSELDAKRRIIDEWAEANQMAADDPNDASARIARLALTRAIQALAEPHAGHPDYRKEWRP